MSDCNSFNVPSGCSGNPCRVTQTNTATCESLPSQIQNFTDQFFGEVIKTELDGVVSWSLPCGLDVGLPNNPRASGEGLACYFLRLFEDGIIGLTGPQGATGAAGTNGNNAYTVLLKSFIIGTTASDPIQVLVPANPAIVEGIVVFIKNAGWFLVTEVDPLGTLFLTCQLCLSPAGTVIPAGSLIVPAGFAGQNGLPGPQGVQGPQGIPGEPFTSSNNLYFSPPTGTNYNLQGTYAQVTFIDSAPARSLQTPGTYLITAVIDIVGLAGVALVNIASFKLTDLSIGDLLGAEHSVSNLVADQRTQVVINTIHTTTVANAVIALQGKCTATDKISAVAVGTTLTFVQLN